MTAPNWFFLLWHITYGSAQGRNNGCLGKRKTFKFDFTKSLQRVRENIFAFRVRNSSGKHWNRLQSDFRILAHSTGNPWSQGQCMEFFSRRRWKLLSAQLSNKFGFCPLYTVSIVFFKWANPGLFFVYFRLFQTNIITIFTANKCEKWPSSIRCRDLNPRPPECEPLPITSRPGLPSLSLLFC